MAHLEKPTDFSALLKKYADSPLISGGGSNSDRERSNSGPSCHDDLNKMDLAKNPDHERKCIAARYGLKAVGETIPIPDLRIEYETEARHIEDIDLEFATREYRGQGMASKSAQVFIFCPPSGYAPFGSRAQRTGTHREDLHPVNIARIHIIALGSFGYTEDEARFLYLLATHSGCFTANSLSASSTPNPGNAA
jgi:hypothetical protein